MKPIIHYVPTENDVIVVGQRATLFNVRDHPSDEVSNTPGQRVSTSNVLEIIPVSPELGVEFETRNSIYQPVRG